MIIQWSDEYRLFLVTIPEFADRVVMPCTHGKTRSDILVELLKSSLLDGETIVICHVCSA